MSNDPRRQKPVTIEWWHDKVGRLLIDGVLWGGVEWSEKRGAWCIEDAEGRYLSHRSRVGGEDEDKAGAIALAEAMIRDGRMPSPEAARKRAKRAPVTTGNHVPERAADPAKQSSRHLRPRTAEEIANEQTAEQLALRIWAAMVAQKVLSGMSALMDELIQSHLLDDDDEEAMRAGSTITTSARKDFSTRPFQTGSTNIPTSRRSTICHPTPIQTLPETPGS